MYQLAHMTKIASTAHDSIFACGTLVDEGAEDGAGAAMVTLGKQSGALPSGILCETMAGNYSRVGYRCGGIVPHRQRAGFVRVCLGTQACRRGLTNANHKVCE